MKKRHIIAIAAAWIVAVAGITINEIQKMEDVEDMRILNIAVEVPDNQYMALKRRAARVGKTQEAWTVDDEINYTAAAALAVMADEELRRERVALRNAQITEDFIVDGDAPIRVTQAHREAEEPTLSDDPKGEPEAAAVNKIADNTDNEYLFMQDITAEETDLLVRCVYAENGNQSLECKTATAEVIRNRVLDPRFPATVTEVINEPGQFAVVANGRINNVTPDEDTIKAVETALRGSRTIPADYIYFNNAPIGSDVIQIGDAYFGR